MSNLIRWEPFRDLMSLRDEMDRMFENFFFSPRTSWLQPFGWEPALDMSEDDDKFLVKASIPGINPEDLEITYNANVLTIKGETKEEKETDERHYHLRERRYGSFCRSITLPSSVNQDKIEATYENGILTLHLPKTEEAKPKRIPILGGKGAKLIEGRIKDVKNKK